MFLGHHPVQLKNSNRITLPEAWRAQIPDGIYLTQGFDQNLLLVTAEAFKQIYEHVSALNITDPLARLLQRVFLGSAGYLELEEDGVIAVPKSLMNYAQLKRRAMLVGQGEYLEIWSPAKWSEQEARILDAQSNADRFSSYVIAVR